MITVHEAIEIVSREVAGLGVERVSITECVGRTLAEPVIADTDMPPFDRSQMDGYAVLAEDARNAPVTLRLIGESAAGRGWHGSLKSGEAVAIMTGAPLPDGADAVQKIELTDRSINAEISADSTVTVLEPTEKGRYIVTTGSEVKKGETLFDAGCLITEAMIATLAAFGYADVTVGRRPRVSILGTGSEIVAIDQAPGRDQIRNSNSVMLAAMISRCGGLPEIRPNVSDDLDALRSEISASVKRSDLLIITGGVSVGKYDLTKAAIADLGAEIYFEKVRLKPGKPAVFARLGEAFVFGLPGNPVSAAVTFHLFVRHAIAIMQGRAQPEPKRSWAVLKSDVRAARERETYLPCKLSGDENGRLMAEPLRWHGSSDFVGYAGSDALVVVARGTSHQAGDVVRIEYL